MGSKNWANQRGEFLNSFMQNWFDNNDILMHSTHNESQ